MPKQRSSSTTESKSTNVELAGVKGGETTHVRAAADKAGLAITSVHVGAGPASAQGPLTVQADPALLAAEMLALGCRDVVVPFPVLPSVAPVAGEDMVTTLRRAFRSGTDHWKRTAALLNERGEALRRAMLDQLGIEIVGVKPVGLEGSGGSTPLRMQVAGDPPTYLFGKLYAMNHVRADRWYKLGRTILYGRLEDETPFQSVRRLVEYEDYTSRLLRDIDIPTAAPCGIVEMTPEREYLFVTSFIDGAHEIGKKDERAFEHADEVQLPGVGIVAREVGGELADAILNRFG